MSDTADHSADHSDESIDTHPDLIDPEWNARVEREAKKAVGFGTRIRTEEPDKPKPPRAPVPRSWFGLSQRTVTAVLGLLILVGLFVLVNRVSDQNTSAPAQPQGAIPVGSAHAAPTPTSRQHSQLNLNAPFTDTPAASWADGATGIQLPTPAAVGRWSVGEVTDAEAAVKQTLVDAHLSPAMLVNHDATAYLADLAPNARSAEQTRLSTPNSHDNGAVSMLAGGFHLLSTPIKVDGTMTADTDPSTGALVIHTNYVFAFPFDPGRASTVSQPWQIIAVQHVAEDFTVLLGSHYHPADRGVWPTAAHSYLDQINCAVSNQGYIAPAFSDNDAATPSPTGDPDALYAPTHSLTIANSCPAPPQHA